MIRNVLVMLLVCSSALGQEATPAVQMQRWVDGQTVAIGCIDVKRIDIAATVDKISKLIGPGMPQPVETKAAMITMQEGLLKAGADRVYLTYGSVELGGMPTVIVPLKDSQQAEQIAALVADGHSAPFKGNASPLGPNVKWKVVDGYVVIGSPTAIAAKETLKPAVRQQLVEALKEHNDAAIQLYLIPSNDVRRVLEETMPILPKELGGGSSKIITQGLQWAALMGDLPPKLSGILKVQASDAVQAQELVSLWKKMWAEFHKEVSQPGRENPAGKIIYEIMGSLEAKIVDRQIVLSATAEKLEPLTELLAKRMSANTGDVLNASNLRQMMIAMHNFHNDFSRLPNQAICDKEGKPLLSWRVALLPYVGQDNLYRLFKFNEPWDSEHNKKLIEKMPKIYQHPVAKNVPANHTLYQVFYSKKGAKPAAAFMENGRMTLGMLTVQDGTSNTMGITDAASKAVPWTKPEDLLYDGTVENLPKLASPRGDQWAHSCFCDGSVRRFKVTANPKLLWQLIGRNDGFNMDVSEVFGGK